MSDSFRFKSPTPAAPRPPLRVSIGVLEVEGASAHYGRAIGVAVQREIQALLQSASMQDRLRQTASSRPGRIEAVDAGRHTVRAHDRAERIGAGVAKRIVDSLIGLGERT